MRNATRLVASAFGLLVGVAGIEHGIGEVLQGDVQPAGVAFLSWPGPGPFDALGGEPAMSLIPNMQVTGALAILFSAAFLVWATLFVERRRGPLVLALLCAPMLLAGAGFSPPVLGLILAAAATRVRAPLGWGRGRFGRAARRALAAAWPWCYGLGLAIWLMVFPGLVLLNAFTGLNNPDLLGALALGMLVFLLLALLTGFARDAAPRSATEFKI